MTPSAEPGAAHAGPVRRRIEWIDVLRGVAILGILPVNAAFFAYPPTVAADADYPSGSVANLVAWALVRVCAEYKFITLFSLLFGIGIGIQKQRFEERGEGFGGVMVRRLLALWLFGVLHATLLWPGDILSLYAPTGLVLCWLAAVRPKVLVGLGAALVALPLLPVGLFLVFALLSPETADSIVAEGFTSPARDGEFTGTIDGSLGQFVKALARHDPDFEAAVLLEAGFWRVTVLRIWMWLQLLIAGGLYFGPRIAGLFLIGMALARTRWLQRPTSEGARRTGRRVLFLALPAGVLLTVASALLRLTLEPTAIVLATGELLHYAGSVGVAGAIAAALALLCGGATLPTWSRPFAAAGRTAFTNYIGQSVLMTLLFYGYGLGLLDRVDRLELLGVVLAVCAFQLAASSIWLRYLRMGPLEWLWRSLTYWRLQPLRRRDQAPGKMPADPVS